MKVILRKDNCLTIIRERSAEITDNAKWIEMCRTCTTLRPRHLCFHEQYFSFLESDRVSTFAYFVFTSTLISNLPSLTTFPIPNFSDSRTFPTSTLVPLSPSASMSLDHSTSSGSTMPAMSLSDLPIAAASPTSLLSPSNPPSPSNQSPSGLDLY